MIRALEAKDISAILEMGYDMQQGSSYSVTEWCPTKVAELCISLIKQPHMQAWVAEVEGKVVGMFFGIIQEHYFGPTLKSGDLLLYVRPENRGGSHAYRLVNAYIEWALEMGVQRDQVLVGVTTAINDKLVDKLYTKIGFVQAGSIYRLGG